MTSEINDGGSAFPLAIHGARAEYQFVEAGMSYRRFVAAQVMAHVVVAAEHDPLATNARLAWAAADALIATEGERP